MSTSGGQPNKKGSKLKWIGLSIAIILLVIIIIGAALTLQTQKLATTPTPTPTPKTTGSSSPYNIQVTKVALDHADAPSGNSYYILTVDASYFGSGTWDVNPFNFQLVSNSSAVYSTTYDIAVGNSMSAVTLSAGQHDIGQIAFELPNGQVPSKLDYIDQLSNVKVEISSIPEVSSWISSVSFAEVNVQGASSLSVSAYGYIQNSTTWYYNRDTISVKIAVTYYQELSGPNSITVTSIADSDQGFTVSSTQPSLPVNLNGNGQEVDITVNVVAPSSSYSGNLHLTVVVSS